MEISPVIFWNLILTLVIAPAFWTFRGLLSEVKREYSEYSAQEIDIEDLVNYIFETSSYKDNLEVEYPEWHKYYGTE